MTKTRLQIDLDDLTRDQIEELMQSMGLTTKKQVFEYALEALQWMIDEAQSGRSIGSIDVENDQYFELVMPRLRSVRKKATEKKAELTA